MRSTLSREKSDACHLRCCGCSRSANVNDTPSTPVSILVPPMPSK